MIDNNLGHLSNLSYADLILGFEATSFDFKIAYVSYTNPKPKRLST